MDNKLPDRQQHRLAAKARLRTAIACCVLLLSLPVIKPASAADCYDDLIRTYEACLGLENTVFSQLTFSLSDKQFEQGHTLKLVLKDQLGRLWLFKFLNVVEKHDQKYGSKNIVDLLSAASKYTAAEDTAPRQEERYLAWAFYQDLSQLTYAPLEEKETFLRWEFRNVIDGNATAVDAYRVFLLFGINSPEIHFIALRINDSWAVGTIQRVLASEKSLEDISPASLPEKQAEFLLKTHVFHWLLANLDTSGDHFLLAGYSDTDNQGIAIIDNSVFPQFFDRIEFDGLGCVDNQTYYHGLFTAYTRHHMRLPLEENYEFIRFVSGFPDDYLKTLLSPLIQNKREIFLRKESLGDYFSKLYTGLAAARGSEIKFQDRHSCNKTSLVIRKHLNRKIAQLKITQKELRRTDLTQQRPIQVYLSYDAYALVWKYNQLKRRLRKNDPTLEEYRDRILRQLYRLQQATKDPFGAGMIAYFIRRFENQIAKDDTDDINEIAVVIPPDFPAFHLKQEAGHAKTNLSRYL